MIAAMVMVRPQPIAFANGNTNADAAAENRYRTTEGSADIAKQVGECTVVDGDDFG